MTGFSRSGLSKSQPHIVRGFTIMELMVVMVIIGILTGLAVPRFLRANAEAVLQGEAQRMLLNFRLAKQAANKTGFRHYIVFKAPRNFEVWRTKRLNDSTFNKANDTLVFRDSVDARVTMGFTGKTYPKKGPRQVASEGYPSTTTSTYGLGVASSAAIEDCLDKKAYPDTTKTKSAGWSSGLIPLCGGATADMAMGVAYMSTPRSDTRFYALTYVAHSIQVHLWSWNSAAGAWEEI